MNRFGRGNIRNPSREMVEEAKTIRRTADAIHEEKKRAPEIYFKQKLPRTRGKQLRTTRRCVEYPRE